jgi:putative holliday junction resolvase
MGRIMAIDFGTRRTGLAVTDPSGIIANPLETVEGERLLAYLDQYFSREPVDTIVLGDPRHLDGSPSGPAEALENFLRYLMRKYPEKKIVRLDERFTSKIARNTLILGGASKKQRKDKKLLDTISAVIILQDYMSAIPR